MNNKGYTLIETIVGITILTIIMFALMFFWSFFGEYIDNKENDIIAQNLINNTKAEFKIAVQEIENNYNLNFNNYLNQIASNNTETINKNYIEFKKEVSVNDYISNIKKVNINITYNNRSTSQFFLIKDLYKKSWGLNFDGVDDGITGNININNNTFTISTWVKLNKSISSQINYAKIFNGFNDKGESRLWLQIKNDNFNFGLRNYNHSNQISISNSFIPTKNNWYYLTLAVQKEEVKMYINGKLESEANITFDISSIVSFSIGYHKGLGEYLDGSIKKIIIWDKALTENQIKEYMNNELTGVKKGLISYYKFNEGQGNVLYDYSGNNHGKIFGANWIYE